MDEEEDEAKPLITQYATPTEFNVLCWQALRHHNDQYNPKTNMKQKMPIYATVTLLFTHWSNFCILVLTI